MTILARPTDGSSAKLVGRVSLTELQRVGLMRLDYPPFHVVVAWSEGVATAMDDTCNHSGGSLARGRIADGCLVCPVHAYAFELGSGRLRRPLGLCADQRTFRVELEGDEAAVYDDLAPAPILPGISGDR